MDILFRDGKEIVEHLRGLLPVRLPPEGADDGAGEDDVQQKIDERFCSGFGEELFPAEDESDAEVMYTKECRKFMANGASVYPCSCVRGVIPENGIYKNTIFIFDYFFWIYVLFGLCGNYGHRIFHGFARFI